MFLSEVLNPDGVRKFEPRVCFEMLGNEFLMVELSLRGFVTEANHVNLTPKT